MAEDRGAQPERAAMCQERRAELLNAAASPDSLPADLAAHLADCEGCRWAYEELQGLSPEAFAMLTLMTAIDLACE